MIFSRFDTLEFCKSRCEKGTGPRRPVNQIAPGVDICSLEIKVHISIFRMRTNYYIYMYFNVHKSAFLAEYIYVFETAKISQFYEFNADYADLQKSFLKKKKKQDLSNLYLLLCLLLHYFILLQEGPCTENIPSWYYDSKKGVCTGFTYGGKIKV